MCSSQSMAIDSACRSLRLRSAWAGVSPLPTTGSSQLKPMYQLFASIVVGSLMPFSRYSLSFFLSSPIATIIAVP